MKVTFSQVINAKEDAFWVSFFDRELNGRLFKEGLGFRAYDTLEQTETDASITRTVRVEPALSLPAPLVKLFGARFVYDEVGTFDRQEKVWRWKMLPSALADKLFVSGTLRASRVSETQTRREIVMDVEAKVMLVGGLIEETFKKQLEDGWQKGADVQNRWLREAAG